MNWNYIRHHNACRARATARLRTYLTPEQKALAAAKRWSATEAKKWLLNIEQPYEGSSVKRITLEIGQTKLVLADMLPVPPYNQCLNLLYDWHTFENGVEGRELTPAAYDVLEKRILELVAF
jgi:hypothetical protein